MAPVRTVVQIGATTLQDQFKLSYQLATRMLALAGYHINLAESFAHVVRGRTREATILKRLINHPRLEELGKSLTQESLEALLKEIIVDLHAKRLKTEKVPDFAPLSQIITALELDLNLQVNLEDDFVTIGTKDELAAAKGAMVVAQKQHDLIIRGGPSGLFRTEAGQETLKERILKVQGDIAERMLRLPGVSDPAEFETELKFLSPYMREGSNEKMFLDYATQDLHTRPRASRRALAEVLREHGFDRRLLDNIMILCSDRPVAVKNEAFNTMLDLIGSLQDETGITLAGVTIFKLLEEESDSQVRNHALAQMAEKVDAVVKHFPSPLEDGLLLPILKNILLADPKTYRANVEKILIAFGQLNAYAVITPLQDELGTVMDPHVKLAYYNIIEALEIGPDAKAANFKSRVRLCYATRKNKVDVSREIRGQLKTGKPASLENLIEFFGEFNENQQLFLVALLEEMFNESLAQSATEQRELLNCRKVVEHFKSIVQEEGGLKVKLAALTTSVVLTPRLSAQHQKDFWPTIQEYLATLIEDTDFVGGFVASGQNYLALLADYIVSLNDVQFQFELLQIAYRKAQNVDLDREQKGIGVALVQLADQGMAMVEEPPAEFDSAEVYRGIALLAKYPDLSAKEISRVIGDVKRLELLDPGHASLIRDTHLTLLAHPAVEEELADFVLRQYIEAFRKQTSANLPPPPRKEDAQDVVGDSVQEEGKVAQEGLLKEALDGFVRLFENPRLSRKCQKSVIDFLLTSVRERTPKKSAYGPTAPRLPDPSRDVLVDTLRRTTDSTHINSVSKSALEKVLVKL